MKTEPIERPHPLDMVRYVSQYNNWHQWITRWNGEMAPDERMSMLHTGLFRETIRCEHDEPKYDRLDILAFYLSLADRWMFESDFKSDGIGRYPMTRINGVSTYVSRQEVSHALARKAFAMLAVHMFAPAGAVTIDHALEEWSLTIVTHRILPELVYFFRTTEHLWGYALPNAPENAGGMANHLNQTKGFLIKLVEVLWAYEGHLKRCAGLHPITAEGVLAMTNRVKAAKPWTIRVMSALKRFDLLKDYPLDDACVMQLKEIAMRKSIEIRGASRKVRSVREAFAVGCPAAAALEQRNALREAENPRRTTRGNGRRRSRS